MTESITLTDEARRVIIQALLIGLDSFGEIERLDNNFELLTFGQEIPDNIKNMRSEHPTGSADTVSIFASALRWMQGV